MQCFLNFFLQCDIVLFNRFNLWFNPIHQEGGFQPKQRSLNKIFSIYLLMDTFKGTGSRFTKLIASIYEETSYIPKISNIRVGNVIQAKHAVTQGRQTLTSLFNGRYAILYQISILNSHNVMSINCTKTNFLHFSENPDTERWVIDKSTKNGVLYAACFVHIFMELIHGVRYAMFVRSYCLRKNPFFV